MVKIVEMLFVIDVSEDIIVVIKVVKIIFLRLIGISVIRFGYVWFGLVKFGIISIVVIFGNIIISGISSFRKVVNVIFFCVF